MKLSRLWQPRHPLFWLMVAFNLLSSICAWMMRSLPLSDTAMLGLGVVALANVAFGAVAAWRLLRGD